MLQVCGLTKRYASIPAVENVSFRLERGATLGYLGPNGSGKTTTVNMLTGLLPPTAGEVLFEGQKLDRCLVEYRRRLGYVPEEPQLYTHLSGIEYLQLIGRLRCLPEWLLNQKANALLELLSLQTQRHAPISSYSKGMRQKVLIAAALLHDPDVLIFDEPLSGLDVTSALVFRSLVKALARDGKAILYSSHVLEVVEKLCSHVVILRKGRIVADDSVERLRELMKLPSLEDVFSQLTSQEQPDRVANRIVDVMKTGSGRTA